MRAKKSLGQHFLRDENIAKKIVQSFLSGWKGEAILEIGPGQGVLTKYLVESPAAHQIHLIELDTRMIELLKEKFPSLGENIFNEDFLEFHLKKIPNEQISIIGNFPYNISSQILFRVLENKMRVPFVVGMFQKEVAQRICSKEGSKAYGILSVLMQAFYNIEYLFEVHEKCFAPPPKVKSAVISLQRKEKFPDIHDEAFFLRAVKAGFNQRRKTLRNSLRELVSDKIFLEQQVFNKRAEQLSVAEWIALSNTLFSSFNK